MAGVFERAAKLKDRQAGEPHPFVDATAYQQGLVRFIDAAREKLIAERTGNAESPLEVLIQSTGSSGQR